MVRNALRCHPTRSPWLTGPEISPRSHMAGKTLVIRNQPSKGEQTTMPEVATPNQAEREFETGTD
ncbi:MAG: hypothetical protein WHT08_18525, partial [Bryobacteraceae bacterium]